MNQTHMHNQMLCTMSSCTQLQHNVQTTQQKQRDVAMHVSNDLKTSLTNF